MDEREESPLLQSPCDSTFALSSDKPTTAKQLSKNQQRRLRKQETRLLHRKEKRKKERERRKLRNADRRNAGDDSGRKKKCVLMADSTCKLRVAVDMSFDDYMNEKDIRMAIKLQSVYSCNRHSDAPLQYFVTNFCGKSRTLFDSFSGTSNWDVFMHKEDFAELFGKEHVVYLTSESDRVLTELDASKVYVIGGLVDHNQHKGLCHKLAVENGIAHARLPISEHIDLKTRHVLTINHVFEILLNFTKCGDWQSALLSVIPKRKLPSVVEGNKSQPEEDAEGDSETDRALRGRSSDDTIPAASSMLSDDCSGETASCSTAASTTNDAPASHCWDNFNCWLHCVCVVTFDLEVGQALEKVFPENAKLTDKERMNICYLAFPDSNSSCVGDTQFYFRFRTGPRNHPLPAWYSIYNEKGPLGLQADSQTLHGYVYFRQVKDKRVPRGYLQKSVVLITHLPLIRLFAYIVQILAPEYFDSGPTCIEEVCHNINHWPKPEPGRTLLLPLVGHVFQVRIPTKFDGPSSPAHCYQDTRVCAIYGAVITRRQYALIVSTVVPSVILPSAYEVELYESFFPILPHLQMLWELVLVGEPLMVIAPSPSLSANLVQALVSLIWPLKYAQDYRPFFTIHDSDFKEYTTKTDHPPNVILGVTNPFFTKALRHWPHIVRISTESCSSNSSSPVAGPKVHRTGDLRTLDSKAGVFTRYKSFLTNDKVFLRRLFKGMQTKRPPEVQDCLMRRHFLELTQSFVFVLERHVTGLMPLQKNISPFKESPVVGDFDPTEFLNTLDVSGPQLTSGLRGDWKGLYRKFLASENFTCWLRQRQDEVNAKLQLLHLEAICDADFSNDCLATFSEVELVDLLLKLKQKLKFVEKNKANLREELRTKLNAQYARVLECLPSDLQTVVVTSSTKNAQAADETS